MNNVLVDTWYWYAYFNPRDTLHIKAVEMFYYIEMSRVILPFPTLYETLNTRFIKKEQQLIEIKRLINLSSTVIVYDDNYNNAALNLTFEDIGPKGRSISLVDMVIRLMLDDININVNYLITFNPSDFIDVCQRRNITLITE